MGRVDETKGAWFGLDIVRDLMRTSLIGFTGVVVVEERHVNRGSSVGYEDGIVVAGTAVEGDKFHCSFFSTLMTSS